MKIKFFYGLILILTSLSLGAEPAESSLPRPKLVVGIVVDQMRWDYLYRYYDRYGDRGFKRLLKEGFTCENTQLNYLPAFTAVGHTCIYTGSVPSVTGIAANDFYIEKGKEEREAKERDVQAWGKRGAWVWQGCHTLLRQYYIFRRLNK